MVWSRPSPHLASSGRLRTCQFPSGAVRTQIASQASGAAYLLLLQRIADGDIDSRCKRSSDAAELLRYRAKWACGLMTNPAPTSGRSPTMAAGGRAAITTTGAYDVETDGTQPPRAKKKGREHPYTPPGNARQKRRAAPRDRKRDRNPSKEDGDDAGRNL